METTRVPVEVRRLSPELGADLLRFFDDVAFADHHEWAGCYCTHFHWDAQMEAEHRLSGGRRCGRDYAVEFMQSGVMQGYLAYLDGEVVGWCNANDKRAYRRLVEAAEVWEDGERAHQSKAVVCFIVAPGLRGRGIATRLLERVCADAAAEGYDYVEAYPRQGARDVFVNHHGPYAMYERLGFTPHRLLDDTVIVRKRL